MLLKNILPILYLQFCVFTNCSLTSQGFEVFIKVLISNKLVETSKKKYNTYSIMFNENNNNIFGVKKIKYENKVILLKKCNQITSDIIIDSIYSDNNTISIFFRSKVAGKSIQGQVRLICTEQGKQNFDKIDFISSIE